MSLSGEQIQAILKALENPKYEWRTIKGVSEETGFNPEQVMEGIRVTSDKIVKSSIPSADGQELFTTRQHFRKHASIGEKILGAIKNRAV